MQRGFSLVELSIVLVILGLLTGGILGGQNLMRAAELRSISIEFKKYQTAVYSFKDKYRALPGDMNNAIDFWGEPAAGCPDNAGTGTETCNGSGDGHVRLVNGASEYGERFTFWQHLVNAGLLEGSYTGIAGSGDPNEHVFGENNPRSKMGNAGWTVYMYGELSGSSSLFDGSYGHTLWVGGDAVAAPNTDILLPEEMWNIDMKMDDGMPAQGNVVVRGRVGCTTLADGSAMTSSVAHAAALDSVYNLQNEDIECVPLIRNAF